MIKVSVFTVLTILLNLQVTDYFAQESNNSVGDFVVTPSDSMLKNLGDETASDLTGIQLHWKKVDDSDFLVNRNDTYNSIRVLPVRGQYLVKVVSDVEPVFSVSNGSGLFQNADFTKSIDNNYIYHNDNTGLVWLRVEQSGNTQLTAYIAESEYFSAKDLLYPLNKRLRAEGGKATRFKLSNNSDRVEKVFIDQKSPYSFEIPQAGILLFRHQIDYEQIDSQFDVLYQVGWQGKNKKNIRNYTTRPEVKRLYEAQCLHQLGQRKDTMIKIDEGGRYTFSSDQPIQAEFYLLSDKQVLLDKRSKISPELEKSVEQLNIDHDIVNNFNTFIDQNNYQEGLKLLTQSANNKQILSLIRAKHSFFKPLHPVRLQEQKMLYAYYSIYSDPELPSNKNDDFYLNENLTDAITKKISIGYFYPFGNIGELEYELSSETFENKLRVAVTNIRPESSNITLLFDTGDEIDLSIESSFTQLNKKLNVVDVGLTILNQNQPDELATLSSEFASKKPVAPFLNSVTGLIKIPEKAKSFKVKSSDPSVWVSIAYPQRTFYRNYEYSAIKDSLLSNVSVNTVSNFIQNYIDYKQIQDSSQINTSFDSSASYLSSLSNEKQQNLQAWTPYFREIFNAELKHPEIASSQIKLFSLQKLIAVNASLLAKRQNRLRKDTLLAHSRYAPEYKIREYAFKEFIKIALQQESYRQILDLAQVILIKHGDDYVLDVIANMYQRLDLHKKAIFYFSLKPQAVNVDNLLASLFYLRQWGLFDDLIQQSPNVAIWNNLRLYQLTALEEYLTDVELSFVNRLGHSWVNEDRFLINYKNSKLIQSVTTLANKQVAYIDTQNTATITVKGPLNLRLRVAKEFPDKRYTESKHKLSLRSHGTDRALSFRSVPAKSWLNSDGTLVGTFGEVDINVPSGVQEYVLNVQDGSAYIYIENKRNLLGLNLSSEETVDAGFVRENALVYNLKDANKKRTIGYLKSSCKKLRKLIQRPIRTYQPVDIDLNLRKDWIDKQLQVSAQESKSSTHWLSDALKSPSSLTVATNLSSACIYGAEFSENCAESLQKNMRSGDTTSAVTLLSYIDRHPELDLSSYRNDVFDYYEWQLVKSVTQSDGRISLESEFLQEDNQYINTLKNDFDKSELSSLFISGEKIQGFQFAQNEKSNVFEFRRLSSNQVILQPLTINYQIDNEDVQSLELTEKTLKKSFNLSSSQSELKFWLSENSTNEFVSIFLDDNNLTLQSKEYFVATQDTPVKLSLNGLQRLKIVSQELNGPRKIEEQLVANGQHIMDFSSLAEETYYRFFILKPSFAAVKQKIAEFAENRQARIDNINRYRTNSISTSLESLEALGDIKSEIFNSKKSTYDLSLSHGRSLDEEQANTDSLATQFTDIEGQYRYYSPETNRYWSGDAKFRVGDGFNAIFANVRADWLPENSPFEYSAYINDWIFSGDEINLNAYTLGIGAAYKFLYKYNHSFTTRVGGFYRDSFGDDLSNDNFRQVQSTIWSPYKENHKFGISASQRWTYDLYLDSQIFSDVRLQTNENPISLDYLQAGFGYRQLYDTASIEASLINRNYFSDDDRDDAFASNRFKLSADWLFKARQDDAFKLGFSYFNNFSASNSAFALNFTWLYHRGNYLEDYRPGEYRFRSTREQRLLENTFDDLEGR